MNQPNPHQSPSNAKKEEANSIGPSEIDTDEENLTWSSFLIFNAMPSWLASFLLNISLILTLALCVMTTSEEITVSFEAAEVESVSVEDLSADLENLESVDTEVFDSEMLESPVEQVVTETEPLTVETELFTEEANVLAGEESELDSQIFSELSSADFTNEVSGRSNSKGQLLKKFGGNAASEEAVALALKWLADHQDPRDGGWWLDHTIGPTVNDRPRTSPDPGEYDEYRIAATSLALLPFLANGQTHRNGEYKKVVFDGLKFLMNADFVEDRIGTDGLDYRDDRGAGESSRGMYSHGLATLVFTECYAMTRDEKLRDFAQGAITFIKNYQDPRGGGWRYQKRSPGDTSVLGWQVMALKSGKLCDFEIKQKPFNLAKRFLKDVALDGGAYFGYGDKPKLTSAGRYNAANRATTAVGLLCNMYLGTAKDNRGLAKGVQWLSELGPDCLDRDRDTIDVYYNYHASQVLKHFGGEKWDRWNTEMRDFLVESQATEGPVEGSWFFDGFYNDLGGRLYVTSLCCLTLEVYYRYLPLYQDDATQDDFILD